MSTRMHHVQTFSADYADRTVDSVIETNGGTYHRVTTVTIYNDGHSDREVKKTFSRSKAQTIAMYRTRRTPGMK